MNDASIVLVGLLMYLICLYIVLIIRVTFWKVKIFSNSNPWYFSKEYLVNKLDNYHLKISWDNLRFLADGVLHEERQDII